MFKLLLFLLLTPTENLPQITSLPIDYPDKENIIRDLLECCPYDETENRVAARIFLFQHFLKKGSKETLYILGRMQGRDYLWQRCPDDPTIWMYLDEYSSDQGCYYKD